MAEDLKPLDKAIRRATCAGDTDQIRELFEAKDAENAALRAEVERLKLTSDGHLMRLMNSYERERRHVEALENILRRSTDGDIQTVIGKIAKEALSPSPGSQEAGGMGLCITHGGYQKRFGCGCEELAKKDEGRAG